MAHYMTNVTGFCTEADPALKDMNEEGDKDTTIEVQEGQQL